MVLIMLLYLRNSMTTHYKPTRFESSPILCFVRTCVWKYGEMPSAICVKISAKEYMEQGYSIINQKLSRTELFWDFYLFHLWEQLWYMYDSSYARTTKEEIYDYHKRNRERADYISRHNNNEEFVRGHPLIDY